MFRRGIDATSGVVSKDATAPADPRLRLLPRLLVTYCPLCDSGLVFDRRVRGPDGEVQVLDFGTSGHLYRSNLVLYDRQHENFWLQLSGTAVAGEPYGSARTELDRIAVDLLGLGTLQELAPEARVLTRDTGVERDYGRNPYWGYDRPDSRPFLYNEGPVDDRLPPMTRVAGFDGTSPIAVTEDHLREQKVLELSGQGGPVTVWWAPGQSAALETGQTRDGRDVGQVVAFQAELPGVGRLSFLPGPSPSRFVDEQTGTRWNLLGKAEEGPLAGRRLTPAPHDVTFWFAWYAFHPDTSVEPDPESTSSGTR